MFAAGYKLASKTNKYTLFAFGDLHRDSESFDPHGLRKFVSRVKSCENEASVVHLGDSFEFMRKRNRDALLAALAQMTKESRLRIDDANKRAVYQLTAELDPIKDKILASVQGNHGWIFDDGRTSEKVLADELGFDWADGAATLNLVLNATGGNTIHTVQVWMSHGYGGGRTRSGDVRQFETAVIPFHEADIYLMGHSHKLWTEPLDPKLGFTKGMNPQQTIKIRWGGRVGSFVRHYQVGLPATYAEERLFPPSLVGWLEFDIRFSRQGGEVRVPIIEGRAIIA